MKWFEKILQSRPFHVGDGVTVKLYGVFGENMTSVGSAETRESDVRRDANFCSWCKNLVVLAPLRYGTPRRPIGTRTPKVGGARVELFAIEASGGPGVEIRRLRYTPTVEVHGEVAIAGPIEN